jgi:hypothetical protein
MLLAQPAQVGGAERSEQLLAANNWLQPMKSAS